jgi:hypothetical protein
MNSIDVGKNLHNLFVNYKEDPNDIKRRSVSTMDYASLKLQKVFDLTKNT